MNRKEFKLQFFTSQFAFIEISMILPLFLIVLTLTQAVYDPSAFTLGPNLVQNHDFTQPAIPSSTASIIYQNNIPNWTCDTECDMKNIPLTCIDEGVSCNANFTQGVDFDSLGSYNRIGQIIPIQTQGSYLVHIEWLPPFNSPVAKQFKVIVNSTDVLTVTASDQDFSTHLTEFLLSAPKGELTLELTQFGSNPNGRGVIVGRISLQELIPISSSTVTSNSSIQSPSSNNATEINPGQQFEENLPQSQKSVISGDVDGEQSVDLISLIMMNNFTRTVNSIPGSRIYGSVVVNFFVSFDRLQLYYFHQQNLTYYSNILLANINILEAQNGNLPQKFITSYADDSHVCSSFLNGYNSLKENLNKEYNYSTPHFLSRNEQGNGFFANYLDQIFFKLPAILIIYLILVIIFKILFNFPISKLFRKYSFIGIIILIIFEGNIEKLTFYFFQECQFLIHQSLAHKLGHAFMLWFFFIALLYTVAGLVCLKARYHKLIKYFVEKYKIVSLYLLGMETLEKSFLPFVFGAIHLFFLHNLSVQSCVLGIVEVIYFVIKLVYLLNKSVQFKFKIVLLSVTSLLRMVFIATFYLFERNNYPPIINQIHHVVVWMYLGCWFLQMFHDLCLFLQDLVKIIRKSCHNLKSKSKTHNKPAEKVAALDIQLTKKPPDDKIADKKIRIKKAKQVTFWHERHKLPQNINREKATVTRKEDKKKVILMVGKEEVRPEDVHSVVSSFRKDKKTPTY